MKIKSIIKDNVIKVNAIINHMPFLNFFKLDGNTLDIKSGLLWHCKIRCSGKNNVIICRGVLHNCVIDIHGDNNRIEIGEHTTVCYGEIYMEDNDNAIYIGKHTCLAGKNHLACTEGRKIIIGDHCLFSSEIVLRTGDSHSILDCEGNRTNQAKDIVIDNHVWIGYRVLINKGVHICEDSIVGTGSVVTKTIEEKNVLMAGNPAKIVKHNVSWCKERI